MAIGSQLGLLDVLLLLPAGMGAGIVGSTAGLASLISYPALLAMGLPPVVANVTNTVALMGSSIGSVCGSRVELRGQGGDIRRWLPIATLGGATGAALLLLGPPGTFQSLVPYLVAGASLLLLASPKLRTLRANRASAAAGTSAAADTLPAVDGSTAADTSVAIHTEKVDDGRPAKRPGRAIGVALFFVCGYGGYFGAAAGVMILALLLAATEKSLPAANAAKNLLLGVANATAAVGFIIFADVQWAAAIPLGIGCVAGGAIGPPLLRRLPPTIVRTVIGLAGLALAVKLALT